jgi:putative Mn2+ efflux pump MntP
LPYYQIVLLALALAADAFTVGGSVGLRNRSPRQIFRLSFHFGLFQALMPLIGVLAGTLLLSLVERWDHWIAAAILGALGIRMMFNASQPEDPARSNLDLTRGKNLVGLSLAVSIDALAAGIGLPAARAPILPAVAIIGLTSALATAVAMLLAHLVAKRIGKWSEVIAGLVLIGLGVKLVIEHLGG